MTGKGQNVRSICFVFIFMFSTFLLIAQNDKGLVLDKKTNIPLKGVSIYYKKSNTGITTNRKGEFYVDELSKIDKNDSLCFSHVGYITKKLSFSDLAANKYIVLLYKDVQKIKEVIVESKRELNSKIHYNELTPLNIGLYSFGSLLLDNKIYIIGGDATFEEDAMLKALSEYGGDFMKHLKPGSSWQNFSGSMHVYDIQADTWTTSDLKFRERAYHNIEYYKGRIYVLGGKRLSTNRRFEYLDDKIEVYDIKKDTILIDNTNPHQTVNFASFIYNDILIVMGGSDKKNIIDEKECSGKVHLFYPETGCWYKIKGMSMQKETKGVLIKDTIYLIGGYNLGPLTEIETYDLTSSKWKVEGQLFYGVERPAVTFNENIIYIFDNEKIQTYNILSKELNMYSIDLQLRSAELFYSNNTLYIFGGFVKDEFSVSPSPDLFSIDLREFEKTKLRKTKTFLH